MRRRQEVLPIDPASHGYPRNSRGEFGAWQDGTCFATWQTEWHKLEGKYQSTLAQFGIVEMEDGTWLSDIFVWSDKHPSRSDALHAAVMDVIDRATRLSKPFINGSTTFPPQISIDEANAIIAWVSGIIDQTPSLLVPDARPKRQPNFVGLPLLAWNMPG